MKSKDLTNPIDYQFKNPDLLRTALTHKSYTNERALGGAEHNERLEFLGDAVLGLIVSRVLYAQTPELAEGEMTRIRSEVVSEPSLAVLARQLGLGNKLNLGRGEEMSGGREKDSLLANAFEALLGAVFVDGGYEVACLIGDQLLDPILAEARQRKHGLDYKTRLQELMQAQHGRPPVYILKGIQGPDHQRIFEVEVQINGNIIGHGTGRSKKVAEQEAARQALLSCEP